MSLLSGTSDTLRIFRGSRSWWGWFRVLLPRATAGSCTSRGTSWSCSSACCCPGIFSSYFDFTTYYKLFYAISHYTPAAAPLYLPFINRLSHFYLLSINKLLQMLSNRRISGKISRSDPKLIRFANYPCSPKDSYPRSTAPPLSIRSHSAPQTRPRSTP